MYRLTAIFIFLERFTIGWVALVSTLVVDIEYVSANVEYYFICTWLIIFSTDSFLDLLAFIIISIND